MKQTDAILQTERLQFRRRFLSGKHRDGFEDADRFAAWCIEMLDHQKGCCAYCRTPIKLIRSIVEAVREKNDGTIFRKLRAVGGDGVRGLSLEIDRRDPDLGYTRENCALVCYFCNNDKSYVYRDDDYETFFGPARKAHFEELARRLGLPSER
jgi:hypothetical protein